MYQNILVTLENSPTDRAIIEHIKLLARLTDASVTLLHVATGVPAQFHGANAGGEEVRADGAYLKQVAEEMIAAGIRAQSELVFGDPVTQIVKWVGENKCDLVAMSTHGHRLVADLILGTTASRVQHSISVPVLMLRAK